MVIRLVGVGEEGYLLTRHQSIVEVDTGYTRGDELRRLLTLVRVDGRTAYLALLSLHIERAEERLAESVEYVASQTVAHFEAGRLTVEYDLGVGGDALGAGENLQRHFAAVYAYHLRQTSAHRGQLVVTYVGGAHRNGRFGYVVYLGIYFSECLCLHKNCFCGHGYASLGRSATICLTLAS